MQINHLTNSGGGTYIGCRYDDASEKIIKSLADSLGIATFNPATMHTTLIYSSKPGSANPGFEKIVVNGVATVVCLEIFKSRQNTNVLVARLDSPFLSSYHHQYMSEFEYSYDHDEYKPHITLSYAYMSDEAPAIPDVFYNKRLSVSEIYYEPLNLNWVK